MELAVVTSLLMMSAAAATPRGNLTTLEDVFFEQNKYYLHSWISNSLQRKANLENNRWKLFFDPRLLSIDVKNVREILQYVSDTKTEIVLQLTSNFGNASAEYILHLLNSQCSQDLEQPIKDVRDNLSDTTCVNIQLQRWMSLMLKEAVDVALQKSSGGCSREEMTICSAENRNCTSAHGQRLAQLLRVFMQDSYDVIDEDFRTPLDILTSYVARSASYTSILLFFTYRELSKLAYLMSTIPTIEPFSFENILYPLSNKVISSSVIKTQNNTKSEEDFKWGIVRSYTGTIEYPCSNYKHRDSDKKILRFYECFAVRIIKYIMQHLQCINRDPVKRPLTWSTVPFVFVHSQCLCLASKGKQCGVKAPEGVDPQIYCLSVLFRDFQRQVWFRPAVTYLDYAFTTRLPVCKLTNFLSASFRSICKDTSNHNSFNTVLSAQCYFKDLVNKKLNCTETLIMDNFNSSEVCAAMYFTSQVICEDVASEEASLPYYGSGDSNLVLFMTYLDVAVRVLTLVTYLACPQLRNLPGKMLIAYQATALVRLLVVRESLEDLSLAVRLDVALDLASTLWLTAYLHFITVCILDLRQPNSISPDEARMVLLRYALLGWVLPAAVSSALFFMDEYIERYVQVGQLLFVIFNYAALCGNVIMFYKNCKFYYKVSRNASEFQKHVKASRVFADLFNFALKTSVLSGAGISFRLIFTQIQGLEHVLGYYHALGTLHGLLLFLLYGCNREARAYWLSIYRSTLGRFPRRARENTHRRRNSFNLVAGPLTDDAPAAIG